MKPIILCAFLACVASSSATKFTDCKSPWAKVKSVEVSGCPDKLDACLLKGDNTKTINIKFTATEAEDTVNVYKNNDMVDFYKRYDVSRKSNTDACQGSGLTCPLQKGQSYTYTSSFVIDPKSEDTKELIFRWILTNEAKTKRILCVQLENKVGDA